MQKMTKSNNQTRSRVVKGRVGTSNTRKMMKVVGALEKEKLNIAHMEAELASVREKRKVISARLKKVWRGVKFCLKRIEEVDGAVLLSCFTMIY